MAIALAKKKREAESKKKAESVANKIQFEVIKPGDALNYPKKGDSVAMHYTASLEDGVVFDNSYNRSHPITFILGEGQVIPGFEEVIPIMCRGQKCRVKIPPDLAYGELGYPPIIPPNSTLIYEIELISFSSIGITSEYLARENNTEKKSIEKFIA